MDYTPSNAQTYQYFHTGYVLDCNPKNCTCTIQRAEGGKLENVPVLNTFGSGGQSTDIGWTKKLRGCHVLLVNVRGVLCVLATIPVFGSLGDNVI